MFTQSLSVLRAYRASGALVVLAVLTAACSAGSGDGSAFGDPANEYASRRSTAGGAGAAGGSGGVGAGGAVDPWPSGGAAGASEPMEVCEAVSQVADNRIRPVDVIWAFDTSPSMNAVIAEVANRLNQMVFTVNGAGIDVRVVIIAEAGRVCVQPPFGGPNCGSNEPGYLYMTDCPTSCWVGSHNALQRLTGAYPHYKHVIRESSIKYFGVVTDDKADDTNDYAVPAQAFEDRLAALDPGWFDAWKFFGIFAMPKGTAYKMLVDQTGGTWTEFKWNQTDYNKVFQDLTQTVTQGAELDCSWEIPPPPAGQTFSPDKVNVRWTSGQGVETELKKVAGAADCAGAPEGGWYYDDDSNPTRVLVCGQNCTEMKADLNARVDILFGCQTEQAVK